MALTRKLASGSRDDAVLNLSNEEILSIVRCELTEILGQPVYRRLVDVPGPIDIVNVFRRPPDVLPHVADMIAAHPRLVWMQLDIRNDDAAAQLTAAGIDVVMDRCLMVEMERAKKREA